MIDFVKPWPLNKRLQEEIFCSIIGGMYSFSSEHRGSPSPTLQGKNLGFINQKVP